MGVAGEESRRSRDLLDYRHRRQRRAERLDPREPRGDLGEHDGVEDDRASLGSLRELLLRPESQRVSSVKRSSRTLLSTNVSKLGLTGG